MMLGFGLVGLFVMLLILGGLILGSLLLVRGLFPSTRQPSSAAGAGESAREQLDQRYARGEISRDEYETVRQDLQP